MSALTTFGAVVSNISDSGYTEMTSTNQISWEVEMYSSGGNITIDVFSNGQHYTFQRGVIDSFTMTSTSSAFLNILLGAWDTLFTESTPRGQCLLPNYDTVLIRVADRASWNGTRLDSIIVGGNFHIRQLSADNGATNIVDYDQVSISGFDSNNFSLYGLPSFDYNTGISRLSITGLNTVPESSVSIMFGFILFTLCFRRKR